MSAVEVFHLPDVGEGLTEAEIVTWHVAVGDTVKVNDVLVDIETAKSVVELPSPFAGVVHELLAGEGETVDVGKPLVAIATHDATSETAGTPGPAPASSVADTAGVVVPGPAAAPDPDEEKPQVLVGPGPTEAPARRRRLGTAVQGISGYAGGDVAVRASPLVRKLARDLGVDLASLATGAGDVITRAAVEEAARDGATSSMPPEAAAGLRSRETRTPVKGVRKVTAAAVSASAFTAPHVTEWLAIDMTPTMELIRRLKADRRWADVRVTPLLLVARAFLSAVRSYPAINATWDDATDEIVVKHYVNLGIAAATSRGLLVPNIKDADRLDLRSLAAAIADLVATARSGRSQPADMADGTVTITNIGALGVDAGTPILNRGEAAILAFGAVREQPWVVNGQIVVREVSQLAMSFDHRLVDGELGSQVLARTGELLSDPAAALLYG